MRAQTAAVAVALLALGLCTTALANDAFVFRPPAIPFATFGPMQQKHVLASSTASLFQMFGQSTKYWFGEDMPIGVAIRIAGSTVPLIGGDRWPASPIATQEGGNWSFLVAEQQEFARAGPLVTELRFAVYQIAGAGRAEFSACNASLASEPQQIGAKACNGGSTLIARVVLKTAHDMDPTDLDVITQPLVYLRASVERYTTIGDGDDIQLYVDIGAQNAIHLHENETNSEAMQWRVGGSDAVQWSQIGTVKQPAFESFGDLFMLDWGYATIGVAPDTTTSSTTTRVSAGWAMNTSRAYFANTGSLNQSAVGWRPALCEGTANPLVASAVIDLGTNSTSSATFFIAYDYPYTVDYFGEKMYARWTQNGTIAFADWLSGKAAGATQRVDELVTMDAALSANWTAEMNEEFASIASLAWRQTFAALEMSYSPLTGEHVAFLKEISTDGDINTMDVIFPASPLFLYTNVSIVKQLLIPVLRFAANKTSNPYAKPYSPHQLGVYPIANATTASQEVMPLENSGNMLLLLRAYHQRVPDDMFFYRSADGTAPNEYWTVLSQWVDYMIDTQLPDPPKQVYTDDFAGPLAHCTNLAAKGIIAVHAFGELCLAATGSQGVNPVSGRNCSYYIQTAEAFAEFWTRHAVEVDSWTGLSYTRLAYDQNSTWSTKYNLVWQRLLNRGSAPFVGGPFHNLATIAKNEVDWYHVRSNYYGFPLDNRHSYQKLDWMTWGASLCESKTCFKSLFTGIFRMANETVNRVPLTDLYDTHAATLVYNFIARPVVGAVFLPLQLIWSGNWN